MRRRRSRSTQRTPRLRAPELPVTPEGGVSGSTRAANPSKRPRSTMPHSPGRGPQTRMDIGIAPPSSATPRALKRPVTPEVAGSSPVAPVAICRYFRALRRSRAFSHPAVAPRQLRGERFRFPIQRLCPSRVDPGYRRRASGRAAHAGRCPRAPRRGHRRAPVTTASGTSRPSWEAQNSSRIGEARAIRVRSASTRARSASPPVGCGPPQRRRTGRRSTGSARPLQTHSRSPVGFEASVRLPMRERKPPASVTGSTSLAARSDPVRPGRAGRRSRRPARTPPRRSPGRTSRGARSEPGAARHRVSYRLPLWRAHVLRR